MQDKPYLELYHQLPAYNGQHHFKCLAEENAPKILPSNRMSERSLFCV